jgi:membrane protease YdiL (CAAX protease family)
MKRHPLLYFFPLAFLLSWYPWVIALARGLGHSGPNPLGVFLAALIVTGVAFGWSGLKEFLGRLVRWRVGVQWYAFVLLAPVAICAAAAGANWLFGAAAPAADAWKAWREIPDRFIFIFLFIGLGEEPGWRGFALEQLQRTRSPLASSLILACIWALWHLPLMGSEFAPAVIPAFLLSLVAATFIQTWMYNRTRGSILIQMIFHSTVNSIGAGFVFPMFRGADFVRLWYVYAVIWALLAAFLIATGKLKAQSRMVPAALT